MRNKATLSAVRWAYENLRREGTAPTLNALVAAVGGSKSTIASHRRTIVEEDAVAIPEHVQAFLRSASDTMTRRIWQEAQELAARTFESRIESMLVIQAGLLDALAEAEEAEADASMRASTAEETIDRLQQELSTRKSAAEHMLQLGKLLGQELGKVVEGAEVSPRSAKALPIDQLLSQLVDGPKLKAQVYEGMVREGYTRKNASVARGHAISYHYLVETAGTDDTTFELTQKGRDRIAMGHRRHAR